MFYIKIADHTFLVENRYPHVEKRSHDYLIPACEPEFVIGISEEEIRAEKQKGPGHGPGQCESFVLLRKLAEDLMPHHVFLMHGVVVEAYGTGILFLAKSGVGKSTHAALWKELPGVGAEIISGDKTFLSFDGGTLFAYGTPWAGNEREQKNKKCPLKKICFLERGTENECTKLSSDDAIFRVLPFVYAENGEFAGEVLRMIHDAGPTFYSLRCNRDLSAAECACRTMFS